MLIIYAELFHKLAYSGTFCLCQLVLNDTRHRGLQSIKCWHSWEKADIIAATTKTA